MDGIWADLQEGITVKGVWREILDVTNTGDYTTAEDLLLQHLNQELNVFGIVWIFRLYKNGEKLEKWSTIEDLVQNFISKNNISVEDSLGAQITPLIAQWIENQKQPENIIEKVADLRQNFASTDHERIWLLVLIYHMTPYRNVQKIHRAEEMVRSEPNNAYFQYVRAYHEEQFQRLESAIQLYREAITLNPYFVDAMINLGNCYNSLAQYEDAIDWYDRALLIREDADAIMNKTIALSNDGRYDNAIQTIDQLLETTQNEETILTKASVYQRRDEPDLALNEFDNALKLNPNSGKTLMHKAYYLASLGREEEGFHFIDLAAEVDPKNVSVLIARAEHYREWGDSERSLEIFDEIISQPELNSAKVHYHKAKALQFTKNFDEAIKELNIAINMDYSDATDYLIALGTIYFKQNNLRFAEISFKKAADLLPTLEVFWHLGRVKECMGYYYDALEYYNMALKEDPLNDIVMIARNRLRTKIARDEDKLTM
jgi:tetratricopeptide (TPR) repeat protein